MLMVMFGLVKGDEDEPEPAGDLLGAGITPMAVGRGGIIFGAGEFVVDGDESD